MSLAIFSASGPVDGLPNVMHLVRRFSTASSSCSGREKDERFPDRLLLYVDQENGTIEISGPVLVSHFIFCQSADQISP